MLHLRTERLQLVAATPELARAELTGARRLGELLGAHIPPSWPPEFHDEATVRWTIETLTAHPDAVGWVAWYVLHREHAELRAVGLCGFAGKPDSAGTVEIGYSIVPECHRFGFAPEAVKALLAWAFGHPEVARVVAHTLPARLPSIRVLEKCGFVADGPGKEPGTLRFVLAREAARPRASSGEHALAHGKVPARRDGSGATESPERR